MFYEPLRTQAHFESRIKLSDNGATGTPESIHLDFKHTIKMGEQSEQRELARDVAQFANTDGGSLIIGVDSPKDPATGLDTAKALVPLPDEGKLVDWLNRALSNYLYPATHRPRPLFFSPWGKSKVAVLNVEPSDVLLAVFRQSEPRSGIEYVYRTDQGKEWFTPEEAAMRLSDARTRATRIKMERILHARAANEAARKNRVALVHPIASCTLDANNRAELRPQPGFWASIPELHEDEFMLIIFDGAGNCGLPPIYVPYHYVEHAWKQCDGMLALELKFQIAMAPSRDGWKLYPPERGPSR